MIRPSTLDKRRAAGDGGDRGETLVELMVTVMILGTAVVALVGGLALAVAVSDIHRKQATAGAAVREFAEVLEREVAKSPTAYHDSTCAVPADYAGLYTSVPAGYIAEITDVRFWSASGIAENCPDIGVQVVSLRVSSADGRAVETLDVVLRKPCRQGESCT